MFFASERDKVVRYCGGVFLKEIEDFFHLFFNFLSGRDKVVQHRGGHARAARCAQGPQARGVCWRWGHPAARCRYFYFIYCIYFIYFSRG